MSEPARVEKAKEIEAEYLLEIPVQCPSCRADIESVQVVRLLRSRVNFTSTLPRRGYMMVCPQCLTGLAAGLGGVM